MSATNLQALSQPLRLLVVGAGAVGGYFGGRLAQAGRDVTFLVRPARAAALRADGLQLRSPHGDATITPQLLTAAELRANPQPFDVVLVSTKAYSLDAAIDDFAPAVGEHTRVLPLLNGMRQLDVLAQRFGGGRVLGGSVRIIGDLDAQGRVLQLTRLGEISYGALPASEVSAAWMAALDQALKVPGVDAILQPDVLATLWQKWWILASMGAVCVLARGAIGQAVSAPGGEAFSNGILDECLALATVNGYPPDARMLADHRARLMDGSSPLTSSMYRDMTRGLPVEADHILGDLLSRRRGLAAPLLNAAYVQLKVYEAQREKS